MKPQKLIEINDGINVSIKVKKKKKKNYRFLIIFILQSNLFYKFFTNFFISLLIKG